MIHRFLEVQDEARTNLARVSLMQFEPSDLACTSSVSGRPLMESLVPVARFGGAITPSTLYMLDLQTQEGLMFDPAQGEALIRRRFLLHPVHVCVLFFPLMIWLSRHCTSLSQVPKLVTLSSELVLSQPGVLLDRFGAPVRTRMEWTRRGPIVARLRNREVAEGGDPEDGQAEMTPAELGQRGPRVTW